MMTDQFVKAYAMMKSNFVSSNILDKYLPFIATIIVDEGMEVVDVSIICSKLKEKYNATFQPTFVRQVLGEAMDRKMVKRVKGSYVPDISEMRKLRLSDDGFLSKWKTLIADFGEYAKKHNYSLNEKEIEKNITAFLDDYDDHVIFNHIGDIDATNSQFVYHWCKYILDLRERDVERHAFVEGLCMANIAKATLFYSNTDSAQQSDLQVFLDTPMIFALLGMDTLERKDAYQYIVEKAKKVGMSLFVFDHNLQEVLGIMERAARWAQRDDYDPAKANKVAQFFRNSDKTSEEMVEYIGEVEGMLNLMGIARYDASYLVEENQFQADEEKISDAIKNEYSERDSKYSTEGLYDNSIRTDVRSIVMTQRKRRGTLSTSIKTAKAIFITTNRVIAKVSKDIACEEEPAKGIIPTSITADIFGTLLWMDYGDENNDYSSFKLLADCRALLRPTPQMIASFNLSLDKAYQKKAEGLTEEKFLFLRSHPIVETKLLDATSGDYSQFTDQTWREVYVQIKADAQFEGDKKYETEKEEHQKTKDKLSRAITDKMDVSEKNQTLERKVESQRESFSRTLANVFAGLVFGVPYVALLLVIIFVQNNYMTFTAKGIAIGLLTILCGGLAGFLYGKIIEYLTEKIKERF
ncbi:MAG: hypothetical protein E7441_02305 [Ruminococcaceae bacterium]|nr:hypothetical protein [Oscillospiraceae bacterium]